MYFFKLLTVYCKWLENRLVFISERIQIIFKLFYMTHVTTFYRMVYLVYCYQQGFRDKERDIDINLIEDTLGNGQQGTSVILDVAIFRFIRLPSTMTFKHSIRNACISGSCSSTRPETMKTEILN